jgi:uncharacterized protein (TIGR03118 family)
MTRIANCVAVGIFATLTVIARPSLAQFYQQTNLASDVPGLAANTDPNLRNPWGIAFAATSPFWLANQVSGNSTLYNGSGVPQGLVVTIPGGSPTGAVFNSTASDFVLPVGGKATFLFATLNGNIAGWNGGSGTTAQIVATTPAAAYTGLALGNNGTDNLLYAAKHNGIDVFNNTFALTPLPGSFFDPNLPAGFSPYNIANISGALFVSYENESSGGGVVDKFDFNGNFQQRISGNGAGGALASPWGMVLAPASFGTFGGDLLVGNEGDGHISAFNPTTGAFLGQLQKPGGGAIVNTGLWGLAFGNGGAGFDANSLYFAAGINGEANGLFGRFTPVPEPSSCLLLAACFLAASINLRRRRLS